MNTCTIVSDLDKHAHMCESFPHAHHATFLITIIAVGQRPYFQVNYDCHTPSVLMTQLCHSIWYLFVMTSTEYRYFINKMTYTAPHAVSYVHVAVHY